LFALVPLEVQSRIKQGIHQPQPLPNFTPWLGHQLALATPDSDDLPAARTPLMWLADDSGELQPSKG